MKVPCVALLFLQFCLCLVAADTTSVENLLLSSDRVAQASNFSFGFEPRRGFQSLAQFLVLSGMAKEDVRNSLQDLANPKQRTLVEFMAGYVVPSVVSSLLAGQSMEIATAYSVMNCMTTMPAITSNFLGNFWGVSPHNMVSQGNVAGQAAGYQLRVQGFDTQDAVIELIKSQLKRLKPVMVLIYDNAVTYYNVVSFQEGTFICLKEDGERIFLERNALLKAMDYNNSYYKLSIKNCFLVSNQNVGQFTIIEQNPENGKAPTNEKLKQE